MKTTQPAHGNNFTFVRWFAAGLVWFGHSFVFLGLPEPSFMGWVPLGPLGVYVFFSISGYLVAKSWENDPHLLRFLARRALRIFPGLVVCVTLSAVLLGPVLSRLSSSEYFHHPQFFQYFENIGLYIRYVLPAVFENNRYPNAVNGSLWSLPVEFAMYILLALLSWIAGASRWVYGIVAFVMLAGAVFWAMPATDMLVIYASDVRQLFVCGSFFWMGAVIQKFRITDKCIGLSNLMLLAMLWLCSSVDMRVFAIMAFAAIPCFFIALGTASHPLLRKLDEFDYSYGIYIYAFPVQQTVAYLFPQISLSQYLALTASITVALAALSWYGVEKLALRLKPASQRTDGLAGSAIADNRCNEQPGPLS